MMAPMRPKAKCPDLLETTDVPTLMTMRCAVKIFARAAALDWPVIGTAEVLAA